MRKSKTINILFWLIFLGIFIGRILLLGKGHLDDTDEIPFLLLIRNYEKLLSFDINAWNDQVFVMWSTYFETLYRLPQVFFLKKYAAFIGMPIESTQALVAIGFVNVLVAMAISYVFYKILLRLSFDKILALLGVLLLASFINSNLYIRHINSYESSFLIHLIALYILLKEKLSYKEYIIAGVLSAVAYFDYYGYFMMYLIVWLIGMYRLDNKNLKNIVIYTLYLASPSFVLLFFLHQISLLSGHSYIDFLFLFSTTIFHGSPDETLSYIYQYLPLVEGNWGLIIFFLTILGALYAFFYRKSYSTKALLFLGSGMAAYILYGVYAVVTKEMVFYGRVFHMYYPFIVIAILLVLKKHKRLVPVFYTLSLFIFILNIKELNGIGYPRTAVYQLGLFDEESDYHFVSDAWIGLEYNFKKPYFSEIEVEIPTFWLSRTQRKLPLHGELILRNFGFFMHYPDSFMEKYQEYIVPNHFEKVYEKLHFMSYPAYTFEYCTKYGRQFFLDKQFKLAVYRKTKYELK